MIVAGFTEAFTLISCTAVRRVGARRPCRPGPRCARAARLLEPWQADYFLTRQAHPRAPKAATLSFHRDGLEGMTTLLISFFIIFTPFEWPVTTLNFGSRVGFAISRSYSYSERGTERCPCSFKGAVVLEPTHLWMHP